MKKTKFSPQGDSQKKLGSPEPIIRLIDKLQETVTEGGVRAEDLELCKMAYSSAPPRLANRIAVVVAATKCSSFKEVIDNVQIQTLDATKRVTAKFVREWVKRFICEGFDGLFDKERSGRPSMLDPIFIWQLDLMLALQPDYLVQQGLFPHCKDLFAGEERWNNKLIAAAFQISPTTVAAYLEKLNIKLSGEGTYCVSHDPNYVAKAMLIDLLYRKASSLGICVLCYDEKTCIQARRIEGCVNAQGVQQKSDRYYREGTTNLLAMLNPTTGKLIDDCKQSKTAADQISFFREVLSSPEMQAQERIAIILDNIASHNDVCKKISEEFPNVFFAFTPVGASWINLVECSFSVLERALLRGNTFSSVSELEASIKAYIKAYNERAKPYKWQYDIERDCNQRLNTIANIKRSVENYEELMFLGDSGLTNQSKNTIAGMSAFAYAFTDIRDFGPTDLINQEVIDQVLSRAEALAEHGNGLGLAHTVPQERLKGIGLEQSAFGHNENQAAPLQKKSYLFTEEVTNAYQDNDCALSLILRLINDLPKKGYRRKRSNPPISEADVNEIKEKEQKIKGKLEVAVAKLAEIQSKITEHTCSELDVEELRKQVESLQEELEKASNNTAKWQQRFDEQQKRAKALEEELKQKMLLRLKEVLALRMPKRNKYPPTRKPRRNFRTTQLAA